MRLAPTRRNALISLSQAAQLHFRDFIAIVERHHTIQSPASVEKLDLLAEYCGIRDGMRIIDVGCGKGWLLRRWASRFDMRAIGLEINPHFAAEARSWIGAQGLGDRVKIIEGPALSYSAEPSSFDLALCIGASFALGSFEGATSWMHRVVVAGGTVAIGEPFARKLPFPPSLAQYSDLARSLAETAEKLKEHGLRLRGLIASSEDDWDRYESMHWRALEDWASENPDHPERQEMLALNEKGIARYLACEREYLGWAIFVCARPAG